MIETTNLQYAYDPENRFEFPDISCAAGQSHLILGPSGCGKTTLLQLIAGIRKPNGGEVVIDGQSLNELGGSRLDKFRGKKVGLVFQQPHFIRALRVKENLMLVRKMAGLRPNGALADQLLDRLGISSKAHSLPSRLSTGERQRAAIACALISEPSVLLADEPTSALDDAHAMAVVELLRVAGEEENAAVVIVTHDRRLQPVFDHQTLLT